MNIVNKQIDSMNAALYNPRKSLKPGDKEYEKLKRSIDAFGYVDPIIWNKRTNTVVGGHQRLTVLKDLGYTNIDVVEVDLPIEEEKALNIALNKVSGEWDAEKLEDLLRELDNDTDLDVTLTGFDLDELDTIYSGAMKELDELDKEEKEKDKKEKTKHIEDDDFDDSDEIPKRVKSGDIWKLGNHKLICGDSLKDENYIQLLENEKADLVFTDPPYGMKKENDGVANDNLNYDDLLEFNKVWIPLTFKHTKDNGSWYCWGTDEPLMDIYSNILKPMIKSNKITFRNLITWRKKVDNETYLCEGACSTNKRSYYCNEKCLFVMCGVQGFNNNSDNYFEGFEPIRQYLKTEADRVGLDSKKCKEVTGTSNYAHWFTKSQWAFIPEEHYKKLQEYYKNDAFKQEYDVIKQEYDVIKQEWYKTRAYFNGTIDKNIDVWEFPPVLDKDEKKSTGGHATPKPLDLCARAIKSSSRENEIVLDVFGGSGSTLIACENLDRQCRMIELEPHWCDVIINRWEQYTGKKAEFIRNIRSGDTNGRDTKTE